MKADLREPPHSVTQGGARVGVNSGAAVGFAEPGSVALLSEIGREKAIRIEKCLVRGVLLCSKITYVPHDGDS